MSEREIARNVATSDAAHPSERDEIRRFEPISFENGRPVRPRIEHYDRVQNVNVDAAALAAALRQQIRGEVRFDDGSRALYATDASWLPTPDRRPAGTRAT